MQRLILNPLTGEFDVVLLTDRFLANCTASESIGDFVHATSGGGPTVATMDIDVTPTQVALGIIISKPTTVTCIVQRSGDVALTGLTPGALYYVGPFGQAVTPRPSPGAVLRTIQFVGQALTTTTLALNIARPVRIRP